MLTKLADGTIEAYEPTLDGEDGDLRYRDAERFLHDRDGPPDAVLEELAQWDLLTKSFQEKRYLCPDCGAEDLQFTTACPSCGSLHVVETAVVHHTECDHVAPKDQFASESGLDSYVCPGCDAAVDIPSEPGNVLDELRLAQQHVCRDCDRLVEIPDPRLKCRQCSPITPPNALERVLYRYELSDTGETWLERQRSARRALVEALTDRGFETELNTAVSGETDADVPVHVYAEDPLLDRRIVATVDERPDEDELQVLHTAATAADAHAIVLTTTGTVTDRAAEAARASDIELLSHRSDGSLERDYEVTEEPEATRPLLQRLTSAVTETRNIRSTR